MKRKDVIRNAFEGDDDVLDMCDPDMGVNDLDDLVEGIYKKLKDYDSEMDCRFKSIDNVGYIFYIEGMLISFAIHTDYRKTNKLWEAITKALGEKFYCMLYSNNVRAIKWLQKNGMQVIEQNNKMTILCQ